MISFVLLCIGCMLVRISICGNDGTFDETDVDTLLCVHAVSNIDNGTFNLIFEIKINSRFFVMAIVTLKTHMQLTLTKMKAIGPVDLVN